MGLKVGGFSSCPQPGAQQAWPHQNKEAALTPEIPGVSRALCSNLRCRRITGHLSRELCQTISSLRPKTSVNMLGIPWFYFPGRLASTAEHGLVWLGREKLEGGMGRNDDSRLKRVHTFKRPLYNGNNVYLSFF